MTEGRGQRTEDDSSQESVVSGQRTEGGRQKVEDGRPWAVSVGRVGPLQYARILVKRLKIQLCGCLRITILVSKSAV